MNMTSLVKSSLNGLSGSSSEAAEGAGRATGEMASGEGARRDPEVVAIARRRQFSGSEKRRLLAEAERCKDAGTLGAFLRREHIYSSMISGWRQQLKEELGLDHFERRSWQGLIAYAVLQCRGLPRSRQSNRSMQFAMLRDNTTVLPN
jgi:transposase-like protein